MIVHHRNLAGKIACVGSMPQQRGNVVSTTRTENVTCRACRYRIGGGGDAASVDLGPKGPRDDSAAASPAMAL